MTLSTRVAACLLVTATKVWCGSTPPKQVRPEIQKILATVNEERILNNLKKLESFGTRNIFSEQNAPDRGVGGAARWIAGEFRSYSPRLEVILDTYKIKKQGRVFRDVEITNVMAVLPGKVNRERKVIVSAHYDSLHIARKPGSPEASSDELGELDNEKTVAAAAPGVTDDGSGTAAVLELARVMSQYEFDNTIVFIAFSGEEYGLLGARLYGSRMKSEGAVIDAVLNNDIIGSVENGAGQTENSVVRVFSEEPSDSGSRQLARYVKEVGERYQPSFKAELVFRHDRFARGGDHTPMNANGFSAVRFTSAMENYSNQHTATDTVANTNVPYIARVTRMNAAALASLAWAPKPPDVYRVLETGPNKGNRVAMIQRGKTRYDAILRWKNGKPEPDLAGYAVVMRATTSPDWEKEIYVGNVTEYRLENVSIDDVVFGVKAIDTDGNESLVSAYVTTPRPLPVLELGSDPK